MIILDDEQERVLRNVVRATERPYNGSFSLSVAVDRDHRPEHAAIFQTAPFRAVESPARRAAGPPPLAEVMARDVPGFVAAFKRAFASWASVPRRWTR